MAIGDEVVLASDPKEEEEEEEEEELVDPQDTLKESCANSSQCAKVKAELEACNDRINDGRGRGEETCEQELFDFMHCADDCVAKSLFSQVK